MQDPFLCYTDKTDVDTRLIFMRVFLTSSPTGPLDGSRPVRGLDDWNHFIERLRDGWPDPARCLMITAFPDDIPASEQMTGFFRQAVEGSGLRTACFDLWDCRTLRSEVRSLCSYDVIFLGGGHVPTQNRFFERLQLREAMEGFTGTVIGISAGSMNSADLVYCQPEEPGEARNPAFVRWLRGLNLTATEILPHYQMVKDRILDGLSLYREITAEDNRGHRFLLLEDGSYLLCENGTETVYGDAWCMVDGEIRRICVRDQSYVWKERQ